MNHKAAFFVALLAAVTLVTITGVASDSSGDGGLLRGEGAGDGISIEYLSQPIHHATIYFEQVPSTDFFISFTGGTQYTEKGQFPALKEITIDLTDFPLSQGQWSVLITSNTGSHIADCFMKVAGAYSISFDSNGGSGSMENDYVYVGDQYEIPISTFTSPAGKGFVSWSYNATTFVPGQKITPSANMVLAAQWGDAQYHMIVLNVDGKGTVSGQGTYAQGSTATISAQPDPGYSFIHWMLDGSVYSTNKSIDVVVDQDMTFTAVFEEAGGVDIVMIAAIVGAIAVALVVVILIMRGRSV